MKVLAIAHSVSKTSGWGRYAYSITSEFIRRGISHSILTLTSERVAGAEKNVLLPATSISNVIRNCWYARTAARNCDTVHAFDAWPFAIYGYVAVLGTRKKLFITGVATYSVIPKERFLKALALKIAYWRSSAVLCVSSYTCKRIQERVKINGRVVFWGASELPLPDAAETSRIRSRYHLENKTPILLTVGQIKHRKGQLDTLKAVALLKKRHPHILYIMVGSDAETGYVKSIRSYAEEYDMVGNYLIVPDVRSDLELAGIYKNADVFLLNSNNEGDHFEGFGLVMLEAAQFGVPSVGSCDCGVQEALIEGHNGYLSRQGDPKNIAQAVEKILTSDRRELAEYAEEFYSRFTWRKTVDAYLEAYETC